MKLRNIASEQFRGGVNMFEMLLWLYDGGRGKLTKSLLINAIIKGWTTNEQKEENLENK